MEETPHPDPVPTAPIRDVSGPRAGMREPTVVGPEGRGGAQGRNALVRGQTQYHRLRCGRVIRMTLRVFCGCYIENLYLLLESVGHFSFKSLIRVLNRNTSSHG